MRSLLRLLACMVPALLASSAVAQPTQFSPVPPPPPNIEQLWSLNATYHDALHGVTFRYPSSWSPGLEYGYWAPSLTQAADPEPIAGFGYHIDGNEPGPYQHTTLEGFGIVYAAVAAANLDACEAIAARVAGTRTYTTATFGSRHFARREAGSGGMSQSITTDLNSTFTNATCYLFELGVAVVAEQTVTDLNSRRDADGEASAFLTSTNPSQSRRINQGLLAIMRTIGIQR